MKRWALKGNNFSESIDPVPRKENLIEHRPNTWKIHQYEFATQCKTTFFRLEARSSNFSISTWSAGDTGPLGVEPISNAFAYFNIQNWVSSTGYTKQTPHPYCSQHISLERKMTSEYDSLASLPRNKTPRGNTISFWMNTNNRTMAIFILHHLIIQTVRITKEDH